MKTSRALLTALVIGHCSLVTPLALAAKEPEAPIPTTQGSQPAKSTPGATYNYEQRAYGPNGASIVAPDKARQVLDGFRAANEKMGKPRYLIYVNRELVNEGGMKLTGRTERTEVGRNESKSAFESDPNAAKPEKSHAQTQINVAVGGGDAGTGSDASAPGKGSADSKNSKVTAENTYGASDKAAPSLADRQTVREVERLLGRPFRYSGAALADQKTAAALIADRPLDHFTVPTDEASRKDREALAKIADVVVEVLISKREIPIVEVSGDRTGSVPDIQLTAIKLSDSSIIGQASSSDVLGKDPQAAAMSQKYDIRDVTEAVALALMEDISVTTK